MTSNQSLREQGFHMLENDLKFLMEAFASVLRRLGEEHLAARLPWVGGVGDLGGSADRALGQAYSIAFQLLNIVEERTASRVRRFLEKEKGPAAEKGLWPDTLREMQAGGASENEILEVLRRVLVEPVLTAHPTEAKRETVRELHREIYSLMNRHENPVYTEREISRLAHQVESRLENLWRTGEIHVTRPTIDAELQNALYYLRDVFPEALTRAHSHLRESWVSAGFDPGRVDELLHWFGLALGSVATGTGIRL
jgi:phosphoenolpyruvate carboxylase